MSSFTYSKNEFSVFYQALGLPRTYIGIQFDELNDDEFEKILSSLCKEKSIAPKNDGYIPADGFKRHFYPIVSASDVIIFNFGLNKKCCFNATFYFSTFGSTVIIDNMNSTITSITINSLDDILLLLPVFNISKSDLKLKAATYSSYWHFHSNEYSILHISTIDYEKNEVEIHEGKRMENDLLFESSQTVTVSEYTEMLEEKLREVFNVSSS